MLRRPTTAYIDLNALRRNFETAREFIGVDQKILAVVKADAYGHGSVECARELEDAGADWFGVALVEEGVELRRNGIQTPILCLGSYYQGQEQLLLDHHLTPVIYDLALARNLNEFLSTGSAKIDVHLKFDTGMGRVGIPYRQANTFLAEVESFESLEIKGLMTHFAAADDPDRTFTSLQIERFKEIVDLCDSRGLGDRLLHLGNTPGSLSFEDSRQGMVRLGGALYGLVKDMVFDAEALPSFESVMTVSSEIAFLKRIPEGEFLGYGRTYQTKRDSVIATIPVGYADGYPRLLSNKADVLIRGKRAPLCGRVSMDWIIVDVTDIEGIAVGDDVTLIGRNENEEISAFEIASHADTISYEITCGFGSRVPRVYDQT